MIQGGQEEINSNQAAESQEKGEREEVIISNILEHVQGWSDAVQAPEQVEIKLLNGLSNACYKVALKGDVQLPPNCQSPRKLLYRKFECEIVNKQVEATLFEEMSEAGLGPKLIHGSAKFRIEGFFEGRPLTIWELRNPVVMEEATKAIFEFHYNNRAIDAIHAIIPMQWDRLGIDTAIEEWGPAVITRIGKMRSKLDPQSADDGIILRALDKIESTYLRPGYQEVLRSLVPRGKIVLSHNDC